MSSNNKNLEMLENDTDRLDKLEISRGIAKSMLFQACQKNDVISLDKILSHKEFKFDINSLNGDMNLLMVCVQYGAVDVAKLLIENYDLKMDYNTLHWINNSPQSPKENETTNQISDIIIKKLLNCSDQRYSLFSEIKDNAIEPAQLFKIKEDFFHYCENGPLTSLKTLVTNPQYRNIVSCFYCNIVDIDNKSENGFLVAVKSGNLEVIQYLLNSPDIETLYRPKINSYNKKGENALLIAAKAGHIHIVEYLLTRPDLQNQENSFLQDQYADVNSTDKIGNNALMVACYGRNLEIIKFLLESPQLKTKINIHQRDTIYEHNALLLAATHNSQELLNYFLLECHRKDEFDLQVKDNLGYNILMHACDNNNYNIVKTLIVDKNMIIDDNTKKILEDNANEYKSKSIYSKTLDLLKTRELYNDVKNKIKNIRPEDSNNKNVITKI